MIALTEVVQLCMDLVKRAEAAEARVLLLERELTQMRQDFQAYTEDHENCRSHLLE